MVQDQEKKFDDFMKLDRSKVNLNFVEKQALDFENLQCFIMNTIELSDKRLLKLIEESKAKMDT